MRLVVAGYDVEAAGSAQAALDALGSCDAGGRARFDLVLLDWQLPYGGRDLLAQIREQHAPLALPVIATVAPGARRDEVDALGAEANDVVEAPLRFEVLDARIRAALSLSRSGWERRTADRCERAVLDNTGDLVLLHRRDGSLLYVSPSSRRLLGYEPAELAARPFYGWLHPLDRRTLVARRRQLMPPRDTFVARMRTKDGGWLWVEALCRTIQHGGGPAVLATCRDVTDHMDRLAGDEPPLPLGGDIVSRPGWRTPPPARRREARSPHPEPPVLAVVVGSPPRATEALTERLAAAITRALSDAASREASDE